MRITNQMMTNGLLQHAQKTMNDVNITQEQIASGKRFQTPSENPTDASSSLQLKSALTVSQGYQESAALIQDWMSETDFCLSQLVDIATDAQKLVQGGINDTMDDKSRATMATELTEMINQAIDLGNTRFQGNYIFSGVRLDSPSFELTETGTLNYLGISKDMKRGIGQSSEVTMNINGDQAIAPLIQAMIKARDNLQANNTTDLPDSLDELESAMDTLVVKQTANGARMRQVETGISNMEDADINLQAILNQKENTDLLEAAAVLKSQETAYQIVLEVGNRAISALNLFDYMQ